MSTPFCFAGGYKDPISGLLYFRARWYDAGTGQWLSVDPMLGATLQPYSYLAEDPINGVDLAGTMPVLPIPWWKKMRNVGFALCTFLAGRGVTATGKQHCPRQGPPLSAVKRRERTNRESGRQTNSSHASGVLGFVGGVLGGIGAGISIVARGLANAGAAASQLCEEACVAAFAVAQFPAPVAGSAYEASAPQAASVPSATAPLPATELATPQQVYGNPSASYTVSSATSAGITVDLQGTAVGSNFVRDVAPLTTPQQLADDEALYANPVSSSAWEAARINLDQSIGVAP